MKKWLSFLLALAMLLCLCACGDDNKKEKSEDADSSTSITDHLHSILQDWLDENTVIADKFTEKEQQEMHINTDLPTPRIVNIALFGVEQESNSVGCSDTMIILSVNRDTGKIKMTSLARDSLVPIEGHGEEKLVHAWAYGGVNLALKTINQAYGMNITDYVYIDFDQFIEVIDYIGGVEVHINQLELDAINYTTDESQKLSGTGLHRLNGQQTLRYVRCRADSDTNRNAREHEVLIAMYEQVRKQPISKLPDTLKKVLHLCHTTLNAEEIMDLATWAILKSTTIESLRLPNSQLNPWSGLLDKSKGWVYVYDLDEAKKVLHQFIYEEDAEVSDVTQYVPTTTIATN